MLYKISFYVPFEYTEKVKDAMFEKGAGKYKKYDHCSWQTKGVGQFCPLEGSKPFIGNKEKVEQVDEYKVEMLCEKKYIKDVLKKMLEVHPYQKVAYSVSKIETLNSFK